MLSRLEKDNRFPEAHWCIHSVLGAERHTFPALSHCDSLFHSAHFLEPPGPRAQSGGLGQRRSVPHSILEGGGLR